MIRSRQRRGFTLIELIVVVIVLGLLMAVALPNFFGASNSAKDSAAQQYLSIAFREFKQQQARNDGVAPTSASFVAQASVDEPELTFLDQLYTTGWAAASNVVYVQNVTSAQPGGTALEFSVRSSTGMMSQTIVDSAAGYIATPQPQVAPPASTAAAAISAGQNHACVLILSDGSIRCWGSNTGGQLGNGTIAAASPNQSLVTGLTGATGVAAGATHTCALLSDGTVTCWGNNGYGELGNGNTTSRLVPGAAIPGLSGVTQIGAGANTSCALIAAGGVVKCWGRGALGALGNGGTADSLTPVTVILPSAASSIGIGWNHSCAGLVAGGVFCWGNGQYGDLGNGLTANQSTPVAVTGITATPTALGASQYNSCALIAGGVKCWGIASSGVGGDGDGQSTTDRLTPVDVLTSGTVSGGTAVPLTGVSAISVDGYGGCATLAVGSTARCWGMNSNGQRGDNTTATKLWANTQVGSLSTVTATSGGYQFNCALLSTGKASCWGANVAGQLGDTTTVQHLLPAPVIGIG